jgi:YVTN family beta-propeller protein
MKASQVSGIIAMGACLCLAAPAATYRSPLSVIVAPDGKTLYVSDKTAGCVTTLDATTGEKLGETPIAGEPHGLALSADGKNLYVTQRKTNSIALIDTKEGTSIGRIPVGAWPVGLALANKGKRLYCCNQDSHTVSVIDLTTDQQIDEIVVVREPAFAAISADESRLVVANYLPAGAGTDPDLAAEVSIIDTRARRQVARVKLPPGSTMAGGVWISPNGKWAYVVHVLGRFDLPITRLEEGWVHTSALSVIDLEAGVRWATVLLDSLTEGAADPWAVTGSTDGKTLWISHRGTHEISKLNVGLIHELLAGNVPEEIAARKDGARDNIWVRITKDKTQIEQLTRDLTALHLSGAIQRFSSGGKGPTGLALSPDGKRLYVANYYGGAVGVLDATRGNLLSMFPLGKQSAPDAVRRGEIYFHDATRCFQHWHSCATCHLDGGRVDGLPWDFLRDGIDNGKDVPSLVNLLHTPPYNRLATRPDARYCIETGVQGSHHVTPEPEEVDDLLAYVGSLTAEVNPILPKFAEAARRGKALFEGKAECASCHPGPYFTDKQMHNVGITNANEPNARYDTPSLVEAYRTAPYFHDGRAITIPDALTKHGTEGLHGNLSELSPSELDDLIAYVLSL